MMVVPSQSDRRKSVWRRHRYDPRRTSGLRGVGVIHHPRAIGGPRTSQPPVGRKGLGGPLIIGMIPCGRRRAPPTRFAIRRQRNRHFASGLIDGRWLSRVSFEKLPEPLRQPHVERAIAIGKKRHDLPSGDNVACASSPSKFVNRVKVALLSGLSGQIEAPQVHPPAPMQGRRERRVPTSIANARRQREHPSAAPPFDPPTSSRSARASAISRRRRRGTFPGLAAKARDHWRRCRRSTVRSARAAGSRQSCPMSPGKPSGVSISYNAGKCPDVRALVDRLSPRLLRTHVGRRAEDGPFLRAVHGRDRRLKVTSRHLCDAKSSTFTTPSGVTLTFASLRSR